MEDQVLEKIRSQLLNIDPVNFCENKLTLDGNPFRLTGNGYKPFSDIYRYVGIKALEKSSLPIVITAGRQVGKTTLACALSMYFLGSGLFGNGTNPAIRLIHAFPQLDLAYSYSKVKLSAMMSSAVMPEITQPLPRGQKAKNYMQSMLDTSSPTNDSLQFKQFKGGNHIWIESTGSDGQRLRGKTADVIFFDEVQLMYAEAISNSIKVLTKAQYGPIGSGVQVYFGTPLQRGSEYWRMWDQSNQQYYHLGCGKCKKYFPLYTPGSNDWEETWLYNYTVRCPHCSHEQNKNEAAERGKWIGTKDLADAKFIGFHINQLYVPDFTKERILAEKPGVSAINTEKSYQNEVLGEFYSGESSIITIDQVREYCSDPERKMRKEITMSEEITTFLGIDIGAKNDYESMVDSPKIKTAGQSYSTAVVLSVQGPNLLSVEFATKFKRNDPQAKKDLIEQMMKRYNCTLGVIDLGFTYDLSQILQNEFGGKFLSSQASPKVNEKIKFNDAIFPKVISFEKDFWYADLYEQLKKGNIRLPFGDYEQIAWLVQHICSNEIKPSVSRTGDVNPHYLKGPSPNDGFCALLNAYLAYKFYISSGFTIKNPLLMNSAAEREKPLALGGYIKRF
jgi:hypothetical protein